MLPPKNTWNYLLLTLYQLTNFLHLNVSENFHSTTSILQDSDIFHIQSTEPMSHIVTTSIYLGFHDLIRKSPWESSTWMILIPDTEAYYTVNSQHIWKCSISMGIMAYKTDNELKKRIWIDERTHLRPVSS